MKSEERHEMQENSLARYLESVAESAKPHAPLIGGIALAVVLGWIGIVLLSQSEGTIKSDEWNSVLNTVNQSFQAGNDDVKRQQVADDFAKHSEVFGSTAPGLWAEFFYAEQSLSRASDLAFTDPEQAAADIERALTSYEKVSAETDVAALKVKAMWGAAQAYELQATPEAIQKAKSTYQEIKEIWPDGETAKVATSRIERLNNAAVDGENGFLAWYREQDFVARSVPPPSRPPLEGTLPGLDDLENPGSSLFNTPGSDATSANGEKPDSLFTPSMEIGDEEEPLTDLKPSSFSQAPQPSTADATAPANKEDADKPGESKESDTSANKKSNEDKGGENEASSESASEENEPAEEETASEETEAGE